MRVACSHPPAPPWKRRRRGDDRICIPSIVAVIGNMSVIFLQIKAQAFEPLEELVTLRGVPCVDGIVVSAVLNIENLAVLA